MLEMSYHDYMRLHVGELRGNPCNLFHYLRLHGDKIELRMKSGTNRQVAPSIKSYVGYY